MELELLQPTATIVSAVIRNFPAMNQGRDLQKEFVRVYRVLEAAKTQIQEEDSRKSQPQTIDAHTLKPITGHGAR
jgi:hypothetical protein